MWNASFVWTFTRTSYIALNTHDTYILIKLQKKCSNYLDDSAPVFKQLDILNFKTYVTPRIYLRMYKIHMGSSPSPNSNLIITNNIYHNYNTRQQIFYIHKLGIMKTVINFSVFMVSVFGITFQRKFQLMYHMPVIKYCPRSICNRILFLI